MLFLILVGVSLIIAFIHYLTSLDKVGQIRPYPYNDYRYTKSHFAGEASGVFIVGVFISFFICLIVAQFNGAGEIELKSEVKDRSNLITLNDGAIESTHASGAFVLIAGGFSSESETELNYAWYQENPETGLIKSRFGIAEDYDTTVDIYYVDEGETPYVTYTQYETNSETENWVIPIDVTFGETVDGKRSGYEKWELHVPEGSIEQDIALDLK